MGTELNITLKEAKSEIDAPDAKVAAAYKLAKERKPSGRLNVEDVERALKTIEGTRHPNKAKDFFERRDELAGKRSKKEISKLSGNAKGGSISKLKAGGFPDLSGDGKVTKKDILMGRGVVKKANGGQINGLKKMGMKVGGLAGRLAQRGYGKARR